MQASQKIIHVVRRFAFDEWGGTETVVWNSAKGLIQAGVPSKIIATSALSRAGTETKQNCQVKRYNYFYPRFRLSPEKHTALDKKGGDPYSYKLYRDLVSSDSRLIHCHSMQRMASMVRIAAIKNKTPYIMSLHGGQYTVPTSERLDMESATKGTINYGKAIDIYTRPDLVLRDASGIVCVGYDEYLAVKKRFPLKPTIYLPNGVNTKAFDNGNKQDFLKKYNINSNSKIILCVSRIDPQKNQMALVHLLDMLNKHQLNKQNKPPYHLVLIGPVTNSHYCSQIVQKVHDLNLATQFTLIRGLDPESAELENAYSAADSFVLPSIHEPFGIVVLEAWAAGIPVIVSRVGGLAKLVDHKKNGLHFNPYKPRTLFDAFTHLEKNKDLQKLFVQNGKAEAERSYSWESYIGRLMQFYDDAESWHNSHAPFELAI